MLFRRFNVSLDISKCHLALPRGVTSDVRCLDPVQWPSLAEEAELSVKDLCMRLIALLKGAAAHADEPRFLHEFVSQRFDIYASLAADPRISALGRTLEAAARTTASVRRVMRDERAAKKSVSQSPLVAEQVARAKFEFALRHLESLTLQAAERYLGHHAFVVSMRFHDAVWVAVDGADARTRLSSVLGSECSELNAFVSQKMNMSLKLRIE